MAIMPDKITQQSSFLNWTNNLNGIIDYVKSIETAPRMTGSLLLMDTDNKLYELKLVDGELVAEETDAESQTRPLRVLYNDTPPESGYFYKGDRVENTNPSPGSYIGWVCVIEGEALDNPQNFKGYGLIES